MTAPATVMLTEQELMRLKTLIENLFEKARKYAGNVVNQWKQAFNTWVQRIQEILGDRPDLQKAIDAWKGAATHITNLEHELDTVTGRNHLWNGPGADGFEEWVGTNITALDQWKRTFGSTGTASGVFVKGLDMASGAVVKFLADLYAALGTLLTGLNDAVGDIGGFIGISIGPKDTGITVNPGAITMAVAKVANAFIMAANQALSAAAQVLTTADSVGNDVGAAANSLTRFTGSGRAWDTLGGRPAKSDR